MPTRSSTLIEALAVHPIQVVARRTGLSADVIRAWEKRYGVVTPRRSAAGRRVYSDGDVERLRLLAQATLTGRTIGQVAALPHAALVALVSGDAVASPARHDEAGAPTVVGAPAAAARASEMRRDGLAVLERLDAVSLDALLRRAVVALSAEEFLDALVVPFWRDVTEGVRSGSLRAAHEHLALALLRRALERVIDAATSPLAPPELVVATPSGQPHELGALLVAATAAVEGWQVLYLGSGLPADAIAETAVRVGARAVALSLGAAASDRVIARELRRVRDLLSRDVALIVEGPAADAHRGVLREVGALVPEDGPALRARLRALRGSRARGTRAAKRGADPVGRGGRARPFPLR